MNPPDHQRIQRLLGVPELVPFVHRLRERLARGRRLDGSITLKGLTPAERDALTALLGRPPDHDARRSVRVSLDAIDARLRDARVCGSLREAIELLQGPVVDRRLAQAAESEAWGSVFAVARNQGVYAGPLAGWTERLQQSGLLKRLSNGDPAAAAELLSAVVRLVVTLPARGLPLATFAAQKLGDAHALDPGTPIATLAVRAAAALGGIPYADTAEGRRDAWACVGILCDELSSPALILNLPASVDTPLGRILRQGADAGEPLHLSLRLLLRYPLGDDPAFHARDIYVCENPTIVALAAARLGAGCAPLVCGNGQPATPVQVLLRQLRGVGARLHYHGDFDFGGLQIAAQVIRRFGAQPWRMGAQDYQVAFSRGRSLERLPLATPWDAQLLAALGRERRAVHEELVAEELLADLGADAG